MTKYSYVLIESTDRDLTQKIIPDAQSLGIEKLFGISKSLKGDITAINAVDTMTAKTGHDSKDDKFNAKFFPHLPKEFTFNQDHELTAGFHVDKIEAMEAEKMIKRVNFLDEDGEIIGQFSVCEKGSSNPLQAMLEGYEEADRHMTHEVVSNPLTLH